MSHVGRDQENRTVVPERDDRTIAQRVIRAFPRNHEPNPRKAIMNTIHRFAAAVLLLCSGAAHAEFLTGEMLWQLLQSSELGKGQAMGYIVGVHDATQGPEGHCSPGEISAVDLTRQTAAMLEKAGALRAVSADRLILRMLALQYPCPAKSPSSGNERRIVPGASI